MTSCSKENDTNSLPDGEYPINFTTSVMEQPSTRATANNKWNGNEEIAVHIGGEIKKYNAAEDGGLTVANGVEPWYWKSRTEEKEITAWYPYSQAQPTSFTVKTDQEGTDHQQSDMMIYASQKATLTNSQLTFKHLPSKVVINLKNGIGITEDDVKNSTITIVNQATTGTINSDWNVPQVASGNSNSTITTNALTTAIGYQKSVQALVVPQQMENKEFIKITIGGIDYFYTPTNSTDANLNAGKKYNYKITVGRNGLTVIASGATEWGADSNTDVTSKELQQSYAAAELKIGDYYYSDGTYSDGGLRKLYTDGTFVKEDIATQENKTVIGIVLKASKDDNGNWKDDCLYKLKDGITTMPTIHGYVLALHDTRCGWGAYGVTVTHDDMNREEKTGFYGYKNTNAIKAFATDNFMNFNAFPAAYRATVGYEKQFSAPDNSSGWFLPSAGQCEYWRGNNVALLESVKKATDNSSYYWEIHYWSSSESPSNPAHIVWYLSFRSDYVSSYRKDYDSSTRSVLAF